MADRPNRPNRPIRPRQGAPAGRRKRRVVIDTGAARPRQDGRQARDRAETKPKEKAPVAPPTGPVTVESGTDVREARDIMLDRGFRHWPVMDGVSLVGVVSLRDLSRSG